MMREGSQLVFSFQMFVLSIAPSPSFLASVSSTIFFSSKETYSKIDFKDYFS